MREWIDCSVRLSAALAMHPLLRLTRAFGDRDDVSRRPDVHPALLCPLDRRTRRRVGQGGAPADLLTACVREIKVRTDVDGAGPSQNLGCVMAVVPMFMVSRHRRRADPSIKGL